MVDVINELTDLIDVSKQGLKLMKIVILGPLGTQGGYLELARPCHRITLIELDLISSTSQVSLVEKITLRGRALRVKRRAGGKPSTKLPPDGLVELL